MMKTPPKRPQDYNQNNEALPEIKYGYASEILPHIQAALGGLFSGEQQKPQEITQQQQSANDAIWARLGQAKTASAPSVGPTIPMQAKRQPGNFPWFENPYYFNYQMPEQLKVDGLLGNSGQSSPVVDPGLRENIELGYHGYNQHPTQESYETALGIPKQSYMQEKFLRSQGIGVMENQANAAQPVPSGGSATPQSNPFLYAQLYGRRGG